jgi:molecular chaperone DnaJ
MAKRDYYDILGVSRQATPDELKAAYKNLAKKHHPDLNPGDKRAEERFKEISEAYAVLSDTGKRRQYDLSGGTGFASGFDAEEFMRQARAAGGGARGFSFGGFGDFSDLFEEIFPGARGGPGMGGWRATTVHAPMQGADLGHAITVEFEQAARGAELPLEVARRVTCPACGGAPRRRASCATCAGSGSVPRLQRVTVRIPPGVEEGARVRVPGLGEEGSAGGPPGDLYIDIHIRPHPYFRREGSDILLDMPVTLGEAAFGARVRVPTIDGWAAVTLPAGTASGRQLRLRGKGVASPRGGPRGDQYVTVLVVLPTSLDDKSRELVREFEKRNPGPPAGRRNWR